MQYVKKRKHACNLFYNRFSVPVALNVTEEDALDSEINELVVDVGKTIDNFETGRYVLTCTEYLNVRFL